MGESLLGGIFEGFRVILGGFLRVLGSCMGIFEGFRVMYRDF